MNQDKIPNFKNEAELEKFCVKHARFFKIRCYKFTCPGETGVADHIFIFPGGETVYVEFKHPNGKEKLEPDQEDFAEDVREQGAAVYECHTFEKFREIVSRHRIKGLEKCGD